jgi:glycosyltransferase involved in cell wall biosynthesis
MNIVFVSIRSPISYLGGAEILTQVIAESLVQRGHRVIIYTAGLPSSHIERGVIIRATPLLLFPLRFRTALMPIYAGILKPFFEQIRDIQDADVVHAIDSDSIMLMSRWSFLRDKFVVTIQDYTLIWPKTDYFSENIIKNAMVRIKDAVALFIRMRIKRKAVEDIRFAVCVSTFIAKEVLKANKHIQVSIIGNCISPTWQHHERRKERDIDILYVGKLMPYKGLDMLLEALAMIPRSFSFKAVVVGEGMLSRYVSLAKKLGIQNMVEFTGPLSYQTMPDYYLRSKIVVSPSIWPEPCGRSIIEAMWTGCAVIATSVGGTPESLVDRTHGYLVRPSDPGVIARAILELLTKDSKRKRFGIQAARYARTHYSSGRIAQEYENFYNLIKS